MDSIIKRVLKDEWPSVQEDIEKLAAEKVKARIEDKKLDVLAQLNGVDLDKMREIATINKEVPVTPAAAPAAESVPASKE